MERGVAETGFDCFGIALDLLAGLLVGQRDGLLIDPFDSRRLGVALQLLEGGGEEAGLVEEELIAGGRVSELVVILMVGLMVGAGLAWAFHC